MMSLIMLCVIVLCVIVVNAIRMSIIIVNAITLNVVMLTVIILSQYALCHYTEWGLLIVLVLSVIRLSGNILEFGLPSVIIHSVIALNVMTLKPQPILQPQGLTDHDVSTNHAAGHVCGDSVDIIAGKPTGSIRISFGYFSTKSDADRVVEIIRKNFVETRLKFF